MNEANCPPLIQAAWNGTTEAVMDLIEQGADVNQRDTEGSTALCIACREGHTEIATLLLEHGPSILANES